MSKWLDLEQFEGHTEGPWGIWSEEGDCRFSICWDSSGVTDGWCNVTTDGAEHKCVGEARGENTDEAVANGRLIAASPLLLSELRAAREMLEEMARALAGLIKACDAGRMVERGVGGMTTKAQLGRSYYNFVHAAPVEDARDALTRYTAMKGEKP